MHWTKPATAEDSHAELEKKLWDAANMLWAGVDLKPSEYSPTVLGLIFLCYADVKFSTVEAQFAHLLRLPKGTNTGQAIDEAMRTIEKESPDIAAVLPKTCHIADKFAMSEGQNGGEFYTPTCSRVIPSKVFGISIHSLGFSLAAPSQFPVKR